MVRTYLPQKTNGSINANSNHTPQGISSIEIIPPGLINWVNGANNMINGANNLVFAKAT